MIHLVTFSDESMSRSREFCAESASKYGVDGCDIWEAVDFVDYPVPIRVNERGCGYWAWKPFIILEHMKHLQSVGRPDGDFIIYSDAGIEFLEPVQLIIDQMDQDIFLFGNHWPHYAWCKRDIIDAIWPTTTKDLRGLSQDGSYQSAWRRYGKQVQASVIFFRVSDYTRAFVKEWLDWCLFEGRRLIDDSPSRLSNHPEFQENRHDQAILTTMAYREGIKLHYWPACYEGGYVYDKHPEYAADNYPTMFFHHRRRNHEWEQVA